jgi:FkbM family methyltransferase
MEAALRHLAAKGFRPRAVLDVGAAQGWWSRRAAVHFPQAEFTLVDPLTENEPSLAALCEGATPFRYLRAALGDVPGERVMNVTGDLDGSSLLSWPGEDPARQRRVPVLTIDGLLAEGVMPPPQLVKIDVQGAELAVLRGGERLRGSCEVVIVEVNLFKFMPECPRVHEVIAHMAARDFFLFDLAGALRRPLDDDLGQLDLVFVAADSAMVASNRWG